MPSSYKDFVAKARERFQARKNAGFGKFIFTRHAEYKMQQYGLSAQRIRRVLHAPRRTEEGIVEKTAAYMQPVSIKKKDGRETWSQEIWVMVAKSKLKNQKSKLGEKADPNQDSKFKIPDSSIKVISAWRYPGVSPKRNPIPEDILRELEESDTI